MSMLKKILTMVLLLSMHYVLKAQTHDAFNNPETEKSIIGDYKLESGNIISIFRMSQGGEPGKLTYWNTEDGRLGSINAVSEDSFIVGPAIGELLPVEIEILKNKNKLVLIKENQKIKAEKVYLYEEKNVTFKSNQVKLSGELKIPKNPNLIPAIILIHGSGPGTREQLELMARFFARQNYAVLNFDKRGCGKSTGDWRKTDFKGLSEDVLAGVKFLKTKKFIDTNRIGLWGISQGGYIAVMAASISSDIHFIISHSGPGVSPREQEKYMLNSVLKRYEIPEDDRNSLLDTYDLMYDYAKGEAPGEKLDSLLVSLSEKEHLAPLLPPSSENITFENLYQSQQMGDPGWFLHIDPDFNPLNYFGKLTCPVLSIFGKNDYTLPVETSVQNIRQVLSEKNHDNFSIQVLESLGHGILKTDINNPFTFEKPHKVNKNYLETILNWLQKVK